MVIMDQMPNRDEITDFCDALLDAGRFAGIEYGPNGLQVPGSRDVTKVASCVSANLASIEGAVERGADLILVHHGLFWKSQPGGLSEQTTRRLRCLLEADANLLAYHLPLDAHPELGNNALLCERLGFIKTDGFGDHDGVSIGWTGISEEPVPVVEVTERIGSLLGREPLLQGRVDGEISSIGFVSGGGTSFIYEATERGLDAMLTGEPSEYAMATASEAGLAFYAAGHYATETLGVQALGELIARQFEIDHFFIDVPNPV